MPEPTPAPGELAEAKRWLLGVSARGWHNHDRAMARIVRAELDRRGTEIERLSADVCAAERTRAQLAQAQGHVQAHLEAENERLRAELAEVRARQVKQIQTPMAADLADALGYSRGDPRPADVAEWWARLIARVREQRAENERLHTQRQAVLDLHPREVLAEGTDSERVACGRCLQSDETEWPWPCPTAQALGVTG